ncbi:ABC transporter substrate-binding protein [Diaminobutyricibacter sp. McL0608]|uniref:ABC transporter substrate-binding protein n=1 Tax=Leifsonia sp. McL0608 TaxID=3143537 RepID=UPI0031F2F8C7
MFKRRTAVIVAATLTLALAGCGTNLQSQGSGTDKPIVYWGTWAANTPQAKLFTSIINDYEKKTGQHIDVQWVGSGATDKLKNAIATGTGPDFYDTSINGAPEMAASKALGDVSTIFDTQIPNEKKTIREVLPASVLKGISSDKGPQFVPYSIFSIGLWYDSATQPDFDTTPPATFDDFLDVAKNVKSSTGKQPIALDGGISPYNGYWFYQLLLSTAGPGELEKMATSPAAWDDPAVRDAAEAVGRLVKTNLFEKDYMATKFPAGQNGWAAGDQTFIANGTWLASETQPVRSATQKPKVIVMPPVHAGATVTPMLGALGWAVNPDSKVQKQVGQFIAFALQKKYNDRIATDTQNIPSRSDSPAPKELLEIQKSLDGASKVALDFDGTGWLAPQWFNNVFVPLDDQMIGGKLTADQFLAQGKQKTAALLGK